MFVIENLGRTLTHQKLVPGNTATALGAEFYFYTERLLPFTSGGTTEIAVGDWIVGATSAAKAEVTAITLSSGTWAAGTAAGTFRIRSQHGTFQSENVKVAAGTNDATIAANSTVAPDGDAYVFPKGVQAKAAFISVTGNTALVSWNGAKPDQTALVGISMMANSSTVLKDIEDIKKFKAIDYTSGSASTINISFSF